MVSESCDNDTAILHVLYLVDAFAKMLRSVGYNYLVGMFFMVITGWFQIKIYSTSIEEIHFNHSCSYRID